ncbi:MAG: hypothetical protein ACJ8E3_07405, partial [Sphingomicrobium sp.]
AEIYHFKQAGQPNWGKIDAAIAKVEAARANGQRITADMYTYTAGATAKRWRKWRECAPRARKKRRWTWSSRTAAASARSTS